MSDSGTWSLSTTSAGLRAAWRAGTPTFGGWSAIGNPFAVELMANAGFDWVGIDTQHGLASDALVVGLLQAAAITRTPAVVRVPGQAPEAIMRALDAGANGVIVPMVSSVDEASAAVAACRYPPAGERSWGVTRAGLGASPPYSASLADEAVICIVMAETVQAIEDIAAIASVPGVDAIFVGPSDLALSYGTDRSEEVEPAILAVRDACLDAGVVPGIYAGSAEKAARWASLGFKLIAVASDAALLGQAAQSAVAALGGAGQGGAALPSY